MHSLKHYKVLHEQNVILTVVTLPQPRVPDSDRVEIEPINDLFMRVTLTLRLHGSSRTFPRRWRSAASTAGSSTS